MASAGSALRLAAHVTPQELSMRKYLTLCTAAVALLSFVTLTHAQLCAQVEVQNLRPAQGILMLAAYSDAASFRKAAVTSMQVQPTAETMQIQVCGLVGNAAAFTLFQDLNSNGQLDSNPFGMPIEPWGTSGKPSAFSAPTWGTAQVALDGKPIVITLTK
jgi:uncharacterized protein (DUF2141 family)